MSSVQSTNADPSIQGPIPLRIRPDITFERQEHQGLTYFILKDPLSLRYFKLEEEQYAALKLLDGRTSLQQIRAELLALYPTEEIELEELKMLITMFHQSGMVVSERAGQGEHLYRMRLASRRRWIMSQLAGSLLFIRFPGVDPDRFLTWLEPKVRFLFRPWFVFMAMLFALSALFLVAMHQDELLRRLPEFQNFFGPRNVFWLALAMAFAKILHELGHGLACKHFGGECHQIGFMLLVFTPSLYCDTSDSWMLPNKWHRAAIGAAGMYVEVILASICTFIWWNTQPGLVHYLCLNLMFVSSVSTVFVNLNPLLRFDGYYILSDVFELPNLAQRSKMVMTGLLQKWCLGIELRHEQTAPTRQLVMLVTYGIASLAYRLMVMFFILWLLTTIFEPYGLAFLGKFLTFICVAGLVLMPIWRIYVFFRAPKRMEQVSKQRLAFTIAVTVVVLLFILFCPLPYYVSAPLLVRTRNAEHVYVTVPGQLDSVRVSPGQTIDAGATLATLKNVDIDIELARLKGECSRVKKLLQSLKRQSVSDTQAAQRIPALQESLHSTEETLKRLTKDQQSLTLVSRREGQVFPPPVVPSGPNTGDQLSTWSGTPLDRENRFCWLEQGTQLCTIGDANEMDAMLIINQSDIVMVRENQFVEVQLDEFPGRTWRGKIAEIAEIDLETAPAALSKHTGGDLTTEMDASGRQRLMEASYAAKVPIAEVGVGVMPGCRGRAKIHAEWRSLGARVWRAISETLSFR